MIIPITNPTLNAKDFPKSVQDLCVNDLPFEMSYIIKGQSSTSLNAVNIYQFYLKFWFLIDKFNFQLLGELYADKEYLEKLMKGSGEIN